MTKNATTPAIVKIKVRQASIEEFEKHFGSRITKAGVLLPSSNPHGAGTRVRFEIHTSSKVLAFAGIGTVKKSTLADGKRPGSMLIAFEQLSRDSKELLKRVLAAKPSKCISTLPPIPVASSTTETPMPAAVLSSEKTPASQTDSSPRAAPEVEGALSSNKDFLASDADVRDAVIRARAIVDSTSLPENLGTLLGEANLTRRVARPRLGQGTEVSEAVEPEGKPDLEDIQATLLGLEPSNPEIYVGDESDHDQDRDNFVSDTPEAGDVAESDIGYSFGPTEKSVELPRGSEPAIPPSEISLDLSDVRAPTRDDIQIIEGTETSTESELDSALIAIEYGEQ